MNRHTPAPWAPFILDMPLTDIPTGKYKIPTFFTDLKPENYGLVVGTKSSQVVCRDYGLHLLREKGMKLQLVNFEVQK